MQMKLYQREGCPHGGRVRRFLTDRGVDYEIVNVPKLGSERREVLALGVDKPEVPVLVDGDTVIQGSDEILAHLESKLPDPGFGDPAYGLTRELPNLSYGDAVAAVKEALATEGFGVQTEVDVRATLEEKLGEETRPYLILGVCNPKLAHQALSGEPGIGLFLPCNVVVAEQPDGHAVVSTIDPAKMFTLIGRPEVEPIAREVGQRLRNVLAALPA
ncbi:MAG: DUF302 domain-containing protein [Myxococcota bacterium]